MTREEEIKQQAKLLCNTVSPEEYFIMGAEWADAHPDIDVRTMAAWQSGYKEAIDNSNTFKVPETSIKDAEEVTSRMQHIEDDMKPIAEFIINYANWNLHKDEWNQPTLTVPLFRVLDALIQRGKPYGECVQNIEEQGEKKPTENAKTLDADKVIAWLVANICDFEYYVKLFKKDFGL